MRFRLLLAILFCAAPLFATSAVRLVAPSDGATLAGDRFATIAWSSDAPLDAEEWEAFLSVDGGQYYAARITPHLDLDVRTFQFCVPNIASDDVRILIRVGDERRETIVEIPQRFSIRASPSLDVGRRFRTAEDAPEAARPGDAPVVQWASGGRDGSQVVVRQSSSRGEALRAAILPLTTASPTLSPQRGARIYRFTVARVARPLCSAPRGFLVERDVLRLTTRMNV